MCVQVCVQVCAGEFACMHTLRCVCACMLVCGPACIFVGLPACLLVCVRACMRKCDCTYSHSAPILHVAIALGHVGL